MGTNKGKLKVEETDADMADSVVNLGFKRSPSVSVPPTPSPKDEDMSAKPSPSPASTPALGAKLSVSMSRSPSKRETPSRRSSSTPTPAPTPKPNGNAKPGPQLVDDLPRAEEEAMKAFVELKENHYQYSTLGRSREALESMTCDCGFVSGQDDPDMACGHSSDCINRLTQVECLDDDCRCRQYCKNQRMQRREYANIQIVLTEKKGFGLRAGSNINKDAFIYEYIGDVVNQPSFVKRMRDYAKEGIRHFYFMMLQKDEFIDATKRGGIGRFANHSCNPNCYVAKWTVGSRVRMGIYAKRSILKDEELTFNYNVDRYGHDAQPCYCGEPNCVGFLGGKTQTDVAAMDDLYLDALGISEEVERYGLKGTKKKKGKKLDEDYVPILKPLIEKDIPKVVQAIRQTQSKKVLLKLLSRIKMTDDQPALRQLMRLRGYSLMRNILEDYLSDVEVCTAVMESLSTWPLLQRNKVEDSKIEESIGELAKHEQENVSTLAKKLLEHWASLETGYRIPKRLKDEGEETSTPATPEVITFEEEPSYKKSRLVDKLARKGVVVRESDSSFVVRWTPQRGMPPPGDPEDDIAREERLRRLSELYRAQEEKKKEEFRRKTEGGKDFVRYRWYTKDDIDEVIESARRQVEERRLEEEERIAAEMAEREKEEARRSARAKEKEKEKEKAKAKAKTKKQHMSPEEKEALKEKRLQKLIGQVVVRCLSKHRDQLDHDAFKKKAKELTCIIAEKEKRSHAYQQGKLDVLSEEKINKIKKFSKEYIAKLLRKLEKHDGHSHSHRPSSSTSNARPSGSGSRAGEEQEQEQEPMMSVEDALDLGPEDLDDENEEEDDEEENSGDPSPASDLTGRGPGPSVTIVGRDLDAATLDVHMAMGVGLGIGTDLDADGDVQMGLNTGRGQGQTPITTPSSSPLKRNRWDQPPDPGLKSQAPARSGL